MAQKIQKAKRSMARLKIGLAGPSGSGKTLSSLQLGYGLIRASHPSLPDAEVWNKICLIDTENESGSLYVGTRFGATSVGEYLTINLEPPYTAQRYIEAVDIAQEAGVEYLIIDSLSHAWTGAGGLLDLQNAVAARSGNSYTAWREVTPQHNKLVDKVLQCPMHVALTLRTKTEYSIEENNQGKKTPRKIGTAPVFRDGIEYEVSTYFDIAQDHTANASKDRTGIFDGMYFTIGPDTGEKFHRWLEGAEPMSESSNLKVKMAYEPEGMTISEKLDRLMKSHCEHMSPEEKKEVAAVIKEITGGTANYKAITDETILSNIYDHFRGAKQ